MDSNKKVSLEFLQRMYDNDYTSVEFKDGRYFVIDNNSQQVLKVLNIED